MVKNLGLVSSLLWFLVGLTTLSCVINLFPSANASAFSWMGPQRNMQVIEVVVHKEDPLVQMVLNWTETELHKHEMAVTSSLNVKDRATNKSKVSGLKELRKVLSKELRLDLVEVRGWLGDGGTPVVLFCKAKETVAAAKKLKAGDFATFYSNVEQKYVQNSCYIEQRWRRKNSKWTSTTGDKSHHWFYMGRLPEEFTAERPKYTYSHGLESVYFPQEYYLATEIKKVVNMPQGWSVDPPTSGGFPWTVLHVDLNNIASYPEWVNQYCMKINAEIAGCSDDRTISCIVLDGELDKVYSINVSIFELDSLGNMRKEITSKNGYIIGGISGGLFGTHLNETINVSHEYHNADVGKTYQVEINNIVLALD